MSASYPLRLVRSEVALMLSRKRNIFGLAVLGVVPIFVGIALWADGGPRGILGGLTNGTVIPAVALVAEAAFFLPLAMAMLAGDAVAGEAGAGTLRYLLLTPVRRSTLLATKFVSLMIGAVLGVAVISVVGLAIGLPLFGAGTTVSLSGSPISFATSLARLAIMACYLAVLMWAFAAIGLFFSTLVDHSLAVTVSLMVVVILSWILEGVTQLSWLHPWLLTHWVTSFVDLLRDPPYWTNVAHGLELALGYIVVFGAAAWARFTTKDVSS